MKYNDLPVWVQNIVIQRAIDQDREKLALKNISKNKSTAYMFHWRKAPEGVNTWAEAHSGNFKPLAYYHGIDLETEKPKQGSQLKEIVNILRQNAHEIHECKRKLDYLIDNIK